MDTISSTGLAHLAQPSLARTLLERLHEAMRADNAAILLMDEDGQFLTVHTVWGLEETVAQQVRIPVGEGVAGTIVATGRSCLVDDLSTVAVATPALRENIRSLIGAPLRVDGHVFGAIHVDSTELAHFTQRDLTQLEEAAERIALALDRARLLHIAEEARNRAESLANQMKVVQEISDIGLAHTQVEPMLEALLTCISQALDADNAAILLPSPADPQTLTLYTAIGPEVEIKDRVRVPIGHGVAGEIAATLQPLILEDVLTHEVANPFLHEQVASLLGVPLLVERRLIGVLHVDTFQPRHFTEDDLRLIQFATDRIALAIDRAQLYEAAQQGRRTAETYARRQQDFLGIASHELRTPLTTMLASLQLARRLMDFRQPQETRFSPLAAEREQPERAAHASRADMPHQEREVARAQDLLARAEHSTRRIIRLVSDLLDTSRIQSGKLQLQLHADDLAALVREVVSEQQALYPDRHIVLRTLPRQPIIVRADPDRLSQVLTNYLTNALKYSPADAPVHVSLHLLHHQDENGQKQVRVAVRDHGPGIPASEREKIWGQFHQISGTAARNGSAIGLGLGLYISREIIERHGGAAGVVSKPTMGSTFWFTLPLVGEFQDPAPIP